MIIRHLKIENFRGIRTLDWHLGGQVICLIGPNDSTKSTVLDALELVLLPRLSPYLSDVDFHYLDIEKPISIEATVGELPDDFIAEDKFGLLLRGYDQNSGIYADPADGLEPVITIRFSMGQDLEPEWKVFKPGKEESPMISWRDRSRLGLMRLGGDIDRHLTWARGSALSRLIDDSTATNQAFIEATRKAREVLVAADLNSLSESTSRAKRSIERMGARFANLKAGVDPAGISIGNSILGLQDDKIPVCQWGLGTRRLAALGVQQCGVGQQSILLIDEIEHGLEPHRIRHLLKQLSSGVDGGERKSGQVIFTSHSPTSIIALPIQNLRFVRSCNNVTTISAVSVNSLDKLQGIARTQSTAFLGRKILVCEGATEEGLCRGLEEYWGNENSGLHPTHIGFVPINGKGRTCAPEVAIELKRLGYEVAVLADSDEPIVPDKALLKSDGIPVFLWEGNVCTEQRIALDLPLPLLQLLLDFIIEEYGTDSILGQIGSRCGTNLLTNKSTKIEEWLGLELSDLKIREGIGIAANKNSWFKNVTYGTRLGEIIAEALPSIPSSSVAKTLSDLMKWIYVQ